MAQAKAIRTPADLDAVVAASEARPVLIFKHSTTWPISARAHREWTQFLASPSAAAVDHAWVRVIEERPLSLGLAERVGVPHQSPQAILLRAGRPLWQASHGGITAKALTAAVQQAG